MNTHTFNSHQPSPDPQKIEPNGWEVARMRFWTRAYPNQIDSAVSYKAGALHAGWLDGAELEPLGAPLPSERPVHVNWSQNSPDRRGKPVSIAESLSEMSNSQEWDLPVYLLAGVAQARRALRDQSHLTLIQQQQMVQDHWPDVFEELRLYKRRRVLAAVEQGKWSYQTPHHWPHQKFEIINRAMDEFEKHVQEVNTTSYFEDASAPPLSKESMRTFLPRGSDMPVFGVH